MGDNLCFFMIYISSYNEDRHGRASISQIEYCLCHVHGFPRRDKHYHFKGRMLRVKNRILTVIDLDDLTSRSQQTLLHLVTRVYRHEHDSVAFRDDF